MSSVSLSVRKGVSCRRKEEKGRKGKESQERGEYECVRLRRWLYGKQRRGWGIGPCVSGIISVGETVPEPNW